MQKLGYLLRLASIHLMRGHLHQIGSQLILIFIGTNKNGKRTALIYLFNDLFGMLFWSIVFYSVNAVVHFPFMNANMSPVLIALLNTVFRAATILVLLPFIKINLNVI